MTQSDIPLLARTLAEARGVKLSTVSRWATRDRNPRLFDRLAAGHGCSTRTVERIGGWFEQHWPRNVEWPPGVPRQESKEPHLTWRVPQ